jgi:hypothetical protein
MKITSEFDPLGVETVKDKRPSSIFLKRSLLIPVHIWAFHDFNSVYFILVFIDTDDRIAPFRKNRGPDQTTYPVPITHIFII